MISAGKVVTATALILVAYIIVGGILHHWVFPEEIPSSFSLRPGDEFTDASSGEILRVHESADGALWGEFIIQPGGTGPPVHVHASTQERVTVVEGKMSALIGDTEREFLPGEVITIPPRTPHKFFNAGDSVAVTTVADEGLSEILGLCVSQLWGMMNDPGFHQEKSFGVQMIMMSPRCDVWDESIPIFAQRAISFIVAPTARLLGYRVAYPEYTRAAS